MSRIQVIYKNSIDESKNTIQQAVESAFRWNTDECGYVVVLDGEWKENVQLYHGVNLYFHNGVTFQGQMTDGGRCLSAVISGNGVLKSYPNQNIFNILNPNSQLICNCNVLTGSTSAYQLSNLTIYTNSGATQGKSQDTNKGNLWTGQLVSITGSSNVIGGYDIVLSGNANSIFGNAITGTNIASNNISGQSHVITNSQFNNISGRTNVVKDSFYNNVCGYGNSLTSSDQNIITGGRASQLSNSQIYQSTSNIITGRSHNIINSFHNVILGEGNYVNVTEKSIIIGQTNSINNSQYSIVMGLDNSLNNYNATFVGGFNNTVSSDTAFVFGKNIIHNENESFAIGFNSSSSTDTQLKINSTGLTASKTIYSPSLTEPALKMTATSSGSVSGSLSEGSVWFQGLMYLQNMGYNMPVVTSFSTTQWNVVGPNYVKTLSSSTVYIEIPESVSAIGTQFITPSITGNTRWTASVVVREQWSSIGTESVSAQVRVNGYSLTTMVDSVNGSGAQNKTFALTWNGSAFLCNGIATTQTVPISSTGYDISIFGMATSAGGSVWITDPTYILFAAE